MVPSTYIFQAISHHNFVLCLLIILQLCILVELLPLSGLPLGSLVVGVSVLPSDLVTTKPRLCIKALTYDTKTKSWRHKSKFSMEQIPDCSSHRRIKLENFISYRQTLDCSFWRKRTICRNQPNAVSIISFLIEILIYIVLLLTSTDHFKLHNAWFLGLMFDVWQNSNSAYIIMMYLGLQYLWEASDHASSFHKTEFYALPLINRCHSPCINMYIEFTTGH